MINIGRFIDLTGQRFGRLVAKYRCDYKTDNDIMWHCKCDCGNEKDIQSKSLRYHKTKSCGCLKSESTKEFNKSTKTKQNKYDLSGEYGIGWTSNTDEEFYFDLEDYDKIKNYCWYKDKHDYICASERDIKNKQVFLHKVILGLEECNWKKIQIDHIKHKKYDNRKSQLRIIDCSRNSMNRSLMKNNTSGVTGVRFDEKSHKWIADIMKNYKRTVLGFYEKFEDAVIARKQAEEKLFGEYSYDNSMKR